MKPGKGRCGALFHFYADEAAAVFLNPAIAIIDCEPRSSGDFQLTIPTTYATGLFRSLLDCEVSPKGGRHGRDE
jgi:hypothetical protein